MLAGGNMEEFVAEENMEEVGLDHSEDVEVEEDDSESEEKEDSEGQACNLEAFRRCRTQEND